MPVRTLSIIAVCAGLPLMATAQDMTDAELLERFNAQRDAFTAATASGAGKTRGLTLVTVDDAVAPQAPATDAPVALNAPTQDAMPTASTASDSATVLSGVSEPQLATVSDTPPVVQPVVFGRLDAERQVNVRIEFDFDSAALSAEQRPKLAQLCSVMKGSGIGLFRIVGHTDASGPDAYNENLSLLRAQEVERYFETDCGMDPARLEAIGLGERFLFNETEPNASENRRVEFQALS